MKRWFFCLVAALCVHSLLSAQTVYLPATHEVYAFLDEMAAKHMIVDYRDAVKPLSRQSIAAFLIRIDGVRMQLTSVEQDQLNFYKEEFYEEMKNLDDTTVSDKRSHLYSYQSEPARFSSTSRFPIGRSSADGKTLSEITNGVSARGNIGSSVGAYFLLSRLSRRRLIRQHIRN